MKCILHPVKFQTDPLPACDDSEVMERPGKGWTAWEEGPVYLEIDKVWWAARVAFCETQRDMMV